MVDARAEQQADPAPAGLRRAISPAMLTAFVVGDMLGAGIYVLVGEVSTDVGGAVWLPFAIALVLASFTACSYAELATRFPHAAGGAYYVHRAFGSEIVTFLVAFTVAASGLASAAALSTAFAGEYFGHFLDAPETLVAVLFIALLALINLRGVIESVRVNVALTAVELAGLLLIVAIGVAGVLDGSADLSRNLDLETGTTATLPAIMAGVGLAFYALIGFEDSVHMAEEAIEPRRSYPRALLGGMLIAGTVYVLVTVSASAVVPTESLAGSSGPLLEVVRQGSVEVPLDLFAIIALLAVANGALINMLMASRLVYGMASEGLIWPGLGRLLPRRRTPLPAILLTSAVAMLLAATGDLGELADTTVLLLLLVFVAVNASVLVLRRHPDATPHFRAPAPFPALGIIVSLVLIAQNGAGTFLRAGLLLGAGVVAWRFSGAAPGAAAAPR